MEMQETKMGSFISSIQLPSCINVRVAMAFPRQTQFDCAASLVMPFELEIFFLAASGNPTTGTATFLGRIHSLESRKQLDMDIG